MTFVLCDDTIGADAVQNYTGESERGWGLNALYQKPVPATLTHSEQ